MRILSQIDALDLLRLSEKVTRVHFQVRWV